MNKLFDSEISHGIKSNRIRLRTQIQCKRESYLLRKGVMYSKLWNEKTEIALAEAPDGDNLVTIYHSLKEEEKAVRKRSRQVALYMKESTRFMNMSGIAEFSYLMILAEIDDIRRFKSPRELVSYSGLCCGIYQVGLTE